MHYKYARQIIKLWHNERMLTTCDRLKFLDKTLWSLHIQLFITSFLKNKKTGEEPEQLKGSIIIVHALFPSFELWMKFIFEIIFFFYNESAVPLADYPYNVIFIFTLAYTVYFYGFWISYSNQNPSTRFFLITPN